MTGWYLDEGLATLRAEWQHAHPGAVVYTIGDASHAATVSEHNPEKAGKAPGATAGEVDAADFMKGFGVTSDHLQGLFTGLVRSRDPRLLYVIYNRVIVSSVVAPWMPRVYKGTNPHVDHAHVSVNDRYADNTSDWHWEALVARTLTMTTVTTKLPALLMLGDDDDMWGGYNAIGRAQALANWLEHTLEPLDADGVYGAKTAAKLAKIFGGDGRKLPLADLKVLHGLD